MSVACLICALWPRELPCSRLHRMDTLRMARLRSGEPCAACDRLAGKRCSTRRPQTGFSTAGGHDAASCSDTWLLLVRNSTGDRTAAIRGEAGAPPARWSLPAGAGACACAVKSAFMLRLADLQA
jgi:hypothetical protein